MTRSPDSLIPSVEEQSSVEKWDDKASNDRMGGVLGTHPTEVLQLNHGLNMAVYTRQGSRNMFCGNGAYGLGFLGI